MGSARGVRRKDDVGEFTEFEGVGRVTINKGLALVDVEARATDNALCKSSSKRLFVDNGASGGIDEECGFFHDLELRCANEVAS